MSDRSTPMSEADSVIAELLSHYVDIMNTYGQESPQARCFREQLAKDSPLLALIHTTHNVQAQLISGQLKLRPGDSPRSTIW